MIIAFPNDGTGRLYHVVNLLGITVHAYRSKTAAEQSLRGDQRIFTQVATTGEWPSGPPGPEDCSSDNWADRHGY